MPPSAITGTSCGLAARAHSAMAETIGTPMPAMTRVVQIDPAPMPTLTASTPIRIRSSVAAPVATLPATRSTSGNLLRSRLTISSTPTEWPCAVSMTSTSTCAATSASARSIVSLAMPTAAPTRRRPRSSLQAIGYLMAFWMSLTVIRPLSRYSWSTTSSFSTLCVCRMSCAWSSVVPTGTVIRFSRVMISAIGRSRRVSKRRSRLVRMPTRRPSLLPSSVIGTPEMRYLRINWCASAIECVGDSVIGLTIIPLSERLTRSTSLAWSSIGRFLWTMPMPPCCAIAMARPDSVTVSMAALASGTFRRMLRVKRDEMSTWLGSTSERRGTSRMSSKVSAVWRPRSTCSAGERAARVSVVMVIGRVETRKADGRRPRGCEQTGCRAAGAGVTGPPRGTSCTSCRCRRGSRRCVRPSGRRDAPSAARRLHPRGPVSASPWPRARRTARCPPIAPDPGAGLFSCTRLGREKMSGTAGAGAATPRGGPPGDATTSRFSEAVTSLGGGSDRPNIGRRRHR